MLKRKRDEVCERESRWTPVEAFAKFLDSKVTTNSEKQPNNHQHKATIRTDHELSRASSVSLHLVYSSLSVSPQLTIWKTHDIRVSLQTCIAPNHCCFDGDHSRGHRPKREPCEISGETQTGHIEHAVGAHHLCRLHFYLIQGASYIPAAPPP